MTDSTLPSVNRPITRIYRAGQAREIEPACGSLRQVLRTIAHVAVPSAGQSIKLITRPLPLYKDIEVIGKPGLVCWAGWEPVLLRLLQDEGYLVETMGSPRRPLPRPDPDCLQKLDTVDPELSQCVRQHERALIRYVADHVDPVHLIAQVALAWPRQKIAVVVTRIKEGRQIRDLLRRYGISAVAVNNDNIPPEVGQVAVCTPVGLSHPPVAVEWLDLVIVLDALEITTKVGQECLIHAERARLFGLLESRAKPAPLERDFLTGMFGFHELVIPCHGCRQRLVQVLHYPIRGGPRLSAQLDVLAAKRLDLWHHELRNRKIAKVATAFRGNLVGTIQEMFSHPLTGLAPSARDGVLVLVDNIEHALALSRRLPDWPVLTGPELCTTGLTAEQVSKLRPVCPFDEPEPLFAIVTSTGMSGLYLSTPGILVRADGGVGLPPLPRSALVEAATNAPRPWLLIDFHDRHHPLLRRWSRWRQEAYAGRGWFAPGVDPVQARVDHFLASRSRGISR